MEVKMAKVKRGRERMRRVGARRRGVGFKDGILGLGRWW